MALNKLHLHVQSLSTLDLIKIIRTTEYHDICDIIKKFDINGKNILEITELDIKLKFRNIDKPTIQRFTCFVHDVQKAPNKIFAAPDRTNYRKSTISNETTSKPMLKPKPLAKRESFKGCVLEGNPHSSQDGRNMQEKCLELRKRIEAAKNLDMGASQHVKYAQELDKKLEQRRLSVHSSYVPQGNSVPPLSGVKKNEPQYDYSKPQNPLKKNEAPDYYNYSKSSASDIAKNTGQIYENFENARSPLPIQLMENIPQESYNLHQDNLHIYGNLESDSDDSFASIDQEQAEYMNENIKFIKQIDLEGYVDFTSKATALPIYAELNEPEEIPFDDYYKSPVATKKEIVGKLLIQQVSTKTCEELPEYCEIDPNLMKHEETKEQKKPQQIQCTKKPIVVEPPPLPDRPFDFPSANVKKIKPGSSNRLLGKHLLRRAEQAEGEKHDSNYARLPSVEIEAPTLPEMPTTPNFDNYEVPVTHNSPRFVLQRHKFYRDVSRNVGAQLLEQTQIGSYLLRLSTKPEFFAILMINGKSKVQNVPISYNENLQQFSLITDNTQDSYPVFRELEDMLHYYSVNEINYDRLLSAELNALTK